jgi:hypothetical protein
VKLTVVAIIAALLPLGDGSVEPEPYPVASDDLRVTESSQTHLVAEFGHSATKITMTSELTADSSKANVTVDGKEFFVERDSEAGTATWDGGGATLTPDDRAALDQLSETLDVQWFTPADVARIGLAEHKELLARLVMLLAEAPVGVAIDAQSVDRPAEYSEPAVREPSGKIAQSEELCAAPASSTAMLLGCQVDDDDGILYMDCTTTTTRLLYHDAESHCFLSEFVTSGPGSSGCLGECGPGCNGIDTYTYDCGEHDRCGRVHGGSNNPWDGNCGDEFWDADDDVLWAEINRC